MGELLLGKFLITPDDHDRMAVHADWGLAFSGGTIEAVGPNGELQKQFGDYSVNDFRDRIIMPGFTNAHMHCYGILSHGITPPEGIDSFESFLDDFWWPMVENRIDHRMIDVTTRATAWELVNSGVTAFCDVLEAPGAIPGALEVQAEALKTVGMKGILSFEACQRIDEANGQAGLKENRDFFLQYSGDPLVTGMMCIHTTFTCSKEFITRAREMADEIGSGIQMHLSESKYEPTVCIERHGKGPVALYDELGYLGPDVLASQGVKLTDEEIDILAGHGAGVVHVPLSNCEVGGGVAPVPKLLAAGVDVGLGTDGYINNFFEVMRGAFLIHKAYNENPEIMPASTVLSMATAKGAKAIDRRCDEGAADRPKTGMLRAGYAADVITVLPDTPTPVNERNIFDQLILYCNPANVMEVYVNGNPLKSGGILNGYDAAAMKDEVREEARRLWDGVKPISRRK